MDPQDETAFRDFVARSSGTLLRTGRLLTGDADAAQDLVQEALAGWWSGGDGWTTRTRPDRHGGGPVTRIESALRSLEDRPGTPTRDLATGALARARQRSRRRGVLTVVSAGAAAVLIAVGVTVALPAPRPTPTAPAAGALSKPRVNVLILGLDAAPGRVGAHPDTILLASTDTRTGDTTVLGLPGNLERVPFPAGSSASQAFPDGFVCPSEACFLGNLWSWAENDGRRYYPDTSQPGLVATTQAVETLTGLAVDETVTLTMTGLARLVDAAGGVDVTVHQRLPIGGSSQDPAADAWIEPGHRHLDGATAVWYARSRWSTHDVDRMLRQHCLVQALLAQADTGRLIRAVPGLLAGAELRTSIRVRDLPAWARLLDRVRAGELHTLGLVPPDRTRPDVPALRQAVADDLAGRSTTPDPSADDPQHGVDPQHAGERC
jgi:LCP family protein required for cell wall assembly